MLYIQCMDRYGEHHMNTSLDPTPTCSHHHTWYLGTVHTYISTHALPQVPRLAPWTSGGSTTSRELLPVLQQPHSLPWPWAMTRTDRHRRSNMAALPVPTSRSKVQGCLYHVGIGLYHTVARGTKHSSICCVTRVLHST
jgi:hypothetical protein